MKKKLFVIFSLIFCFATILAFKTSTNTNAYYIQQADVLSDFVMDYNINLIEKTSVANLGLEYSASIPTQKFNEYINLNYYPELLIVDYSYIQNIRDYTGLKQNIINAQTLINAGKYKQALDVCGFPYATVNNINQQTEGSNVLLTGGLTNISERNFNVKYFGLFYLTNKDNVEVGQESIAYSTITDNEESNSAKSLAYAVSNAYNLSNSLTEVQESTYKTVLEGAVKRAVQLATNYNTNVDYTKLTYENMHALSNNLVNINNVSATVFDDKLNYSILANCFVNNVQQQIDVTNYLDFCINWDFSTVSNVISYNSNPNYLNINRPQQVTTSAKVGKDSLSSVSINISKFNVNTSSNYEVTSQTLNLVGDTSGVYTPTAVLHVKPNNKNVLIAKTINLNTEDYNYSYTNNTLASLNSVGQTTVGATISSDLLEGQLSTNILVDVDFIVTIPDNVNADIVSNLAQANPGDTVVISNTPNEGYSLVTYNITYLNEQGSTVTITTNTFTMPKANVVVEATFTNRYTLTVKHLLSNGLEYKPTESVVLTYNDYYSYSSKALSNTKMMIVDKTSISGNMPASAKTITFTYSLNPNVNLSEGGTTGAIDVISEQTGFSIKYDLQGATRDWYRLFTFGDSTLFNGCIRYIDSANGVTTNNWYDGNHGHGHNHLYGPSYNWDAVVPYSEKKTYTISVNPDGTIYWYAQGLRVLWFDASKYSEENLKKVSDFSKYLINYMRTTGLTILDAVDTEENQDATISNVSVGFAVTPDEHILTVKHTSNDNSLSICDYTYNYIPNYAYSIDTALTGYTTTDTVSGSSINQNTTVTVNYTRNQTTQTAVLDDDFLVGYKGLQGTEDADVNAKVVNVAGNFYLEMKLTNVYQLQSVANDESLDLDANIWRTVLFGLQGTVDPELRRMFRMDSYSWSKYEVFGKFTQRNFWWSTTEEFNSDYAKVMKGGCDLTVKIIRTGNTIVTSYIMYSYLNGKTYDYSMVVFELTESKINIELFGEDCTYTVDYIKMEGATGTFTPLVVGYNNNNRPLGWDDDMYKINGLTGDFTKTITVYQQAFYGVTESMLSSPTAWDDIRWKTTILGLYDTNAYHGKKTFVRLDNYTWTHPVGSSSEWTTGVATFNGGTVSTTGESYIGNTNLYYQVVKNSYLTFTIVRSGSTATIDITIVPCNESLPTLNASYTLTGVTATSLDISIVCENANFVPVSVA